MFIQKLNTHWIFKQLAKALIRLCACAGWSEALLVAHTTLMEITCHGSNYVPLIYSRKKVYVISYMMSIVMRTVISSKHSVQLCWTPAEKAVSALTEKTGWAMCQDRWHAHEKNWTAPWLTQVEDLIRGVKSFLREYSPTMNNYIHQLLYWYIEQWNWLSGPLV